MIRFIISDLRRMWAGAVVVVLLVGLATALGVTVTLQERALRLGSARAADKFDLVIGAAGSETQLVLSSVFLQPSPLPLMPGDILKKLNDDPRVAWAAPVGFGDSFAGYPLIGTTTALVENTTPGFEQGHIFTTQTQAVVGAAVDLPLGAEMKPMHGTAETGGHTHTEIAYTVSGRLKATGTPWDRAILVPIRAVWHIHGFEQEPVGLALLHNGNAAKTAVADEHASHEDEDEHNHAHDHEQHDDGLDENFDERSPGLPAILVKPKTIADAYRLRQEFRGGETLAVFPAEVLTRLYGTLGDAKYVLTAVATGAQALVAAALVLVTVIHIGQRRRQIGALRAFGAPRFSVSAIVWLELFLLIAIGILTGFAMGFAAAKMLAHLVTSESGVVLPVEFQIEDVHLAVIVTAFASLLAALPAWLAYRQPPAQALRL